MPKPPSLPTDPGEQIESPPEIPSLDSDREFSLLPQGTAGFDRDSELSASSKTISGAASEESEPESEGETASPESPAAIAPIISPTATPPATSPTASPPAISPTASPPTTSPTASPPAISPTASPPTTSPTASPTPPGEPIEFSDVPEDNWANHFIIILSGRRIIEGFPDKSFKPEQPVTRAQLAAIIQKVFDKADTKDAIAFQDTPADYWANSAIDKAVKTGFMKGYPGEVFRPDEEVPRVQVLVALISGLDATPPAKLDETLAIYQDQEQIPQWAREKIATATQSGLVVNHPEPESLNPNQPATRAEVAAMIYQALVISGQAEEYDSEYIIRPNEE